MLDAPGEGMLVELRQHRRRFGDRPPDQHQRRRLRVARHQPAVGVEQAGDVLPRLERTDEQEIAERRRRRRRPDGPGRPPRPADGDPVPGHAEPRLDFAGRVGRDGDDVVGLVRMAAGQRRVAPGELGLGPLRMMQEVEVVDGRQPHAGPGGHERRLRRLDDVPWAAGQPFDRRPGPPLPERPSTAGLAAGRRRRRRRGSASARSRSFHELANRVIASRPAETRTSASASRWTYSPTPVRVTSAGR